MPNGSTYSYPAGCGGTTDPLSCYNDCWQNCATGAAGCVIWCQNNDPSGNYKKYQQAQSTNLQTPSEFYGGAGSSIRGNWAMLTYPEHRYTILSQLVNGSTSLEPFTLAITTNLMNNGIFVAWENGTIESLTSPGPGQVQGWRPGGVMGSLSNLIVSTYSNPPASTGKYIQYLAENAGFPQVVSQAYAAQGTGFNTLNPVMDLWKLTRGLTYGLFALVFVILGLMIMLRYKVDPKTVVSLQNSLPRVILTLILITFSYPIVGFLIDIMYVLIAAIFNLVKMSGMLNATELQLAQTTVESKNIFESFQLLAQVSSSVGKSLNTILLSIFQLFGADVSGIPGVGGIVSTLGGLIISIMVVRALFQAFIQLLFAYGGIIFGAILGPIAILPDVVPGQNAFINWLKMILSSVLTFPLVVLLLLMGQIFSTTSFSSKAAGAASQTFFAPPLIGIGDANTFRGIMALLIILLLPAVSQMVQDLLGTKAFKYGAIWEESFKWIRSKASTVARI